MQRLHAAMNGQTADRIPVFCNLFDQGSIELGISLEEYYSRGEYVAEGQLRMRERYGYDNLWSLFYVGKEAELMGCKKILFAKDGPPNVADLVIRSYDDIHRLEAPRDIASHPAFAESKKCLAILRREAGGKYPICAYVTASMTLPAILMGMEKWLHLLLMGPAEVRDELLAKCHDLFIRQAAAYREAGADILLYSNPFGSTDFVSMSFFEEHSLPWIEKDIQAVSKQGVVYYAGMARVNPVIELVLARTGINAYYLSPFDDPREAQTKIGENGIACGVINDIQLIDWSVEQTTEEVKRILRQGMTSNRFLFGTGLMPYGIPEQNIRALLEAAYTYGRQE